MQSEKNIKSDIEAVRQVKSMLNALQGVYVGRMQKVKTSILQSRQYYEGLFDILAEMLVERESFLIKHPKKSGMRDQQLTVLFTGSDKFAGSINREVFHSFLRYVSANKCEAIVIGKIGKDLTQQYDLKLNFKYVDWHEGSDITRTVEEIAHHIIQYSTVRMFFAQYINLSSQEYVEVDLYKGLRDHVEQQEGTTMRYIFEPEKDRVINFFETKVLESFLLHTFQELYLALMGSRVFRMEESSTNANKLTRVLEQIKRDVHKDRKFRSQLANLTRISSIRRSQLTI